MAQHAATAATTPQNGTTYRSLWLSCHQQAEAAQALLVERYGSDNAIRNGFGYHNADHGKDVSAAADRIAHYLHETGSLTFADMTLAPVAGWYHDAEQGPGHEARSANVAADALRRAGFTGAQIATVQTMIAATRVTGVDGHRLLQDVDPGDPRQALLADADLSSLGAPTGVYRCLLLHLEQQHLAGQLVIAEDSAAMGIDAARDATISYLTFQAGLMRGHRYHLDITRTLYPHQDRNADLVDWLLDHYRADRIDHPRMMAYAKNYAAGAR